ncbi:hypothetical protein C8R45DRAFT_861071 [Mycena sanguinolenta]|nr:hypothetical protein C8R45DRAFT_861071 [Mycena sanguinolenta]
MNGPIIEGPSARTKLEGFYADNQGTINSSSKALASALVDENFKAVDDAVIELKTTSAVLIQGLDSLQKVHPFIEEAVVTFALVTKLHMQRHQNDKKILFMTVQVQDMMSALFQLRVVPDPDVRGPDNALVKTMAALAESMADDMKKWGNVTDVYMSKDFLQRTLRYQEYEQIFANFGTTFHRHKQSIGSALGPHVTAGSDATNEHVEEQGDDLTAIRKMMKTIFRRLDTPLERNVIVFIKKQENPASCINNDAALARLVTLSRKPMASFDPTGLGNTRRGSDSLKETLGRELAADLDKTFERHMRLYSRKLDSHRDQLTSTIASQGDSIITAIAANGEYVIDEVTGGLYKKVLDEDLNVLWKTQNWRGSVKARNFALALKYYFTDKMFKVRTATPESASSSEAGSTTTSPTQSPKILAVDQQLIRETRRLDEDRWALAYLGVSYLQQIVEAVDDDGAGYVSIKEANDFAHRRPEEWSLLQWLAFCAAGWHTSVTWYRTRIYNILSAMITAMQYVKPSNLQAANSYLTGLPMRRVELLLRATRPTAHPALEGTPLRRITDEYQINETKKFARRLDDQSYVLDNNTIQLVTKGRRYVYPLLYVLLKRQFDIFRLGCIHTLDPLEFDSMGESIASIFAAVDRRKKKLEAIFMSHGLDVDERMGQFAFGMFQLMSTDQKRDPIKNTIRTFQEQDAFKYRHENLGPDSEETVQDVCGKVDPKILQYDHQVDLAHFNQELVFSFSRYCDSDSCDKLIVGTKIFCVQCMDDVGAQTVDLCSSCSERKVRRMGIVHTQSHLMIETTRPIHDGETAVLVPRSKAIAARVKRDFKFGGKKSCCCCAESVTPSCWVCLICVDTYVCKSCAIKRATSIFRGPHPEHKLAHPLLWIFDSDPIVEVRSAVTNATLATLETKIAAMEEKFDRRLKTLEERLQIGGQ